MYSNEIIQTLEKRIGFGSDTGLPFTISESLKVGTSGRVYSFFHKLVTIQNLYYTIPLDQNSEPLFIAFLDQMIENSVRAA